MDEKSFHSIWGTDGAAAVEPPTRSLDEKSFADKWLTTPEQPVDDATAVGDSRAAGVNFLRGVPIAGAYADKATAALNAVAQPYVDTPGMSKKGTYKERYEENLKRVKSGVDKWSAEHPIESGVDQFLGGTAALGPVAATGTGARALGLVGNSLLERGALGAASGAAINGLDSLAQSGGDLKQAAGGAAVGSVLGGATPFAARAVGAGVNKLLSPAADTATNFLLQKAEQYGIPIRPAQVSTSPFINKLDQMVPKIPGSGMGKAIEEQHTGFNRAVAQTFGENANAITPDVMAAAKKRIGSEFDAVEKGTRVQFDHPLISKLDTVVKDATDVLEPGQVTPLAKRVSSIIDLAENGEFDGKTFNNMMKKGAPLDRLQNSTDPNVKYYAGQIRTALQDALERSASPEMAQRYNQARLQYKNMKTIQPLAEKAATGNVSPLLLLNEVRKSSPNFAYGGGGDLADLARIGQRFMRQPPDSGTPLGQKVLDAFVHGAPALAGAALGGGAHLSGYGDPATDIGLGLGGLLATGLAARGAGRVLMRPQMIENALSRLPVYSSQAKNLLLEQQTQ